MTALSFLFAFVLMLGVLIAVHEFGHFVAAKLCGVRVLKFSLGFGPPVGFGRFRLRWERGATEYAIAWFPLGGFVKMLGEQPGEEESAEARAALRETLGAKRTWQKLTIVFAGPFMNLALPVFVFVGSLAVGIERPAPRVGTVEIGSPAEAAGLRAGDEILAVGGREVRFWTEVEAAIREQPEERLPVRVRRDGQEFSVELEVERRSGLDVFRLVSDIGWGGLRYSRQAAVLGIRDLASPAAVAGLRSGDRVTAIDAEPIEDWTGFAAAYAARRGAAVTLTVESTSVEEPEKRTVTVPALGDVDRLGVIPASVLISEVSEGRPAQRAGLAPGDLILSVDGQPVGSFASFAETVRASQGRALAITYARGGETRTTSVAAELQTLEVAPGIEEEAYLIGILAEDVTLPGAVVLEQERLPWRALPRAVALSYETTTLFLRGLGKLVTGEISRKNIGGPIEIGRQAHLALQAGWDSYLRLLVLISINLGILNLLPIPILDGGQAVVFLVEGVKRAPLSLRTREIIQQLGLLVLVSLMGFAFWNDVSRHWSRLVDWVRSSTGL